MHFGTGSLLVVQWHGGIFDLTAMRVMILLSTFALVDQAGGISQDWSKTRILVVIALFHSVRRLNPVSVFLPFLV